MMYMSTAINGSSFWLNVEVNHILVKLSHRIYSLRMKRGERGRRLKNGIMNRFTNTTFIEVAGLESGLAHEATR